MATTEELRRLNAQKDALEEINNVLEEQERLLAAAEAAGKSGFEITQRKLEIQRLENEVQTEGLDLAQQSLLILNDTERATLARGTKLEEILNQQRQDLENVAKQLALEERRAEILADIRDELRTHTALVGQAADLGIKINAEFKVAFESTDMFFKQMARGLDNFSEGGVSGFKKFGTQIEGVLSTTTRLFKEMETAAEGFNQEFRFGQAATANVKVLSTEMFKFGRTSNDVFKTQGLLNREFTDFVMLSQQQQKSLARSANLAAQLGVKESDYAKILQANTKLFNVSTQEQGLRMREFAANAQSLRMSQTEYFGTLATMSRDLAKFGDLADDVFKDLQHTFRVTGIEAERLIQITNEFDTFEGAAKQAGKLNAALGGNFVNAMELMMAQEPAERFNIIRDAIVNTGTSFQDMSYYQRLFLAESLGLKDTAELGELMSGNMDMFSNSSKASAEALEQQEKAAQLSLSVMSQLNAILANNSAFFVTLASNIAVVTQFLIDNSFIVKGVITIMVFYKTAMATATLATTLFGVATGKSMLLTLGLVGVILLLVFAFQDLIRDGLLMRSPSRLVLALIGFGNAMGALNTAIVKALPSIAIVTTAFGAVAASIFFVGEGMSMTLEGATGLVSAFSDLGDSASSAALGLGILMTPFVAFMALIAGLTATGVGPTAVLTIIGLGVGFLALGYGINLATENMAPLLESLALMLSSLTPAVAALSLMPSLFAAIALSMALLPIGRTMAFSRMTTSLAELTKMPESLSLVADQIERIADAIDQIPVTKAIAIQTMVDATVAGATAAPAVTPATFGGGGEATTTKQEISLNIDGDTFASVVLDIVGNAVRNIRQQKA